MVETEGEQFSLRWNNFHSNLSSGFHALLQGEDLVDVTLAAAGQFIQAHKIVLSVCSPYFKELFKVSERKYLNEIVQVFNRVNLGCLHPVACVRSGDGGFISFYATSLS
jgi:hypothetical protein